MPMHPQICELSWQSFFNSLTDSLIHMHFEVLLLQLFVLG